MDVAILNTQTIADRRFDHEPAAVTDIVDRLFHATEIDAAFAQQEAVFLAVELAYPFAPQLANLLVDVVALLLHVGRVVVDLDGG